MAFDEKNEKRWSLKEEIFLEFLLVVVHYALESLKMWS